jgi:hypothetical protein
MMNAGSDPDRMAARRALRVELSERDRANGPSLAPESDRLPQFDFPVVDLDAFDPEKTLKRRPVTLDGVRPPSDAASTLEILAEDILEEAPLHLVQLRNKPARPDSTDEIDVADILEVSDAFAVWDAGGSKNEADSRLASDLSQPAWVRPSTLPVGVPIFPVAPSRPQLATAAPETPEPSAVCVVPVAAESPGRRRADATFQILLETPLLPKRRLGWVLATLLALAIGVLAAAVTATKGDGRGVAVAAPQYPEAKSSRASTSPAKAGGRPMNAGANGVPELAVDALPHAPVGTVTGSPEHRLYVDGTLMHGTSALVRCGMHTVQVGSMGKPQAVLVPCGSEVVVR